MSLKLVGATITLGVSTWIGFQIAARYRRRPEELRRLQTGLALLATEIEYGATPMPAALRSAGQGAGPVIGPLFLAAADHLESGGGITPGEAMAAALDEGAASTCLSPPDLEILRALAPVLGASGRQDQIRHLRLAQERLGGAEVEALAERGRYERLFRYAGVLSGLALILILI